MKYLRRMAISLTCLASFLAMGCGRSSLVPAQGKVTFRGYPLNNGLVVLVPERGPLAIGRIQSDGNFVLFTGDKQGAYPGNYRISVSSLAQQTNGYSDAYGRFEFPRSAIPERYRDPDLFDRTCAIQAGKSNSLTIDLPDQE